MSAVVGREPGVAVARRRRDASCATRSGAPAAPTGATSAAVGLLPPAAAVARRRRLGAPGPAHRVGRLRRDGRTRSGARWPRVELAGRGRRRARRGRGCSRRWRCGARPRRHRRCAGPSGATRPRRCAASWCWAPRGRRRSTGLVLAELGARVVRVEHPGAARPVSAARRARARVRRRSRSTSPTRGRDARVREPAGAPSSSSTAPRRACSRTSGSTTRRFARRPRVAAFEHEDRPGYGLGAECRGGWAARYDPPRLGAHVGRRSDRGVCWRR